MKKTANLAILCLLYSCAHVVPPSSMPASLPIGPYVQVDPLNPEAGYYLSYEGALSVLKDKRNRQNACTDAMLSAQEKTAMCEAQLKADTPSWFEVWGRPVLYALSGFLVGGAVGVGIGLSKK